MLAPWRLRKGWPTTRNNASVHEVLNIPCVARISDACLHPRYGTKPPPGARTAGQQQRDLSASLLAPRCLQDGVQALRRSQEAQDALLSFSPSPLQPLSSAYPANGSLTAPWASIFSSTYFVPGTALGTAMDQTDPCLRGAHARGSGLPSGLEYPSFVCSCCCLPCRPCSSWQTFLTLQKLAPSVPVVSGTV